MQFRVLGPLEIVGDDGQEITISGAKERIILAALLIDPGEVVSSDRLIDILWGEDLPSNPANALQARISALRKSLGRQDLIVTQPPGYRLAVRPDNFDAARFVRILAEARSAAIRQSPNAADLYEQTLSLWRGDPFADFAFEDFTRAEISRLEELRTDATEERLRLMVETGRHKEAVSELEGLVVEHPLREGVWALLMLALYRSGRQADALRAFGDASRILGEELGIEPTAELRQLEDAILTQDPLLSAPAVTATVPGHNLPARLTSLVGRSHDTESVAGLLEEHRLITLIGPGGVGKTSLALACGEQAAARFEHGVWLVELAAISDPDLVPVEVARSLGLSTGDRSTLEQVGDRLRDRRVLILLDNCEHMIDAAAELVAHVLQRAPEVRVIATSREPLGVPGEIIWPTRPLAAPPEDSDQAELEEYDAVRLFVERARAALPGFALDATTGGLVSEICRRLDGLPLALELAAARVRSLPVAEIASRLDDRFRLLTGTTRTLMPRQQTLQATIAWSHDLLEEEERPLFQRLSVFSGGWTLAAAEAVSTRPEEVLDLLSRLVDRSLVNVERTSREVRYSMLETVRIFASEKLAESGDEEQAALRHARWFLDLAESAQFQGPDQAAWAASLHDERDNLRIAIGHCLRHGDLETAMRLGAALGWWWFFGNREEGRTILDQILDATSGHDSVADRIPVLLSRALLDFFNPTPASMHAAEEALATAIASEDAQSAALSKVYVASSGVFGPETDRPLLLLDEAISVFREAGDRWGEGFAGFQRMEVLAHRGDLTAAIDQGEVALAAARETGDPWATSAALAHLGRYGRLTGRIEWSGEIIDEAVDLARSRHLPHTVQYVMTDQGYLRLLVDEQDEARRIFEMALAIAIEVSNPVGVATIRNAIGESQLTAGSAEDAQQSHREALAGFQETGMGSGVAYTLARLGLSAETAEAWKEAEEFHREGLRVASDMGGIIELVPVIEGLARVAASGEDAERAARLLAAARTLRNRTGLVALPVEEAVTSSVDRRIRATAGSDVLDRMTAESEGIGPKGMIAMAAR